MLLDSSGPKSGRNDPAGKVDAMTSNVIGPVTPQPYPLVCFRNLDSKPWGQARWLVVGWDGEGRPVVVPDASGLQSVVPKPGDLQMLEGIHLARHLGELSIPTLGSLILSGASTQG